jgi:hypothetical protein
MSYLGDYKAGDTIHFHWTCHNSSGSAVNRSVAGDIVVYKDDSVTEDASNTTITDTNGTSGFDSRDGLNHCKIDTSLDTSFYTDGSDYSVILVAATIDTQTVLSKLASFSLRNRRNTTGGRYSFE